MSIRLTAGLMSLMVVALWLVGFPAGGGANEQVVISTGCRQGYARAPSAWHPGCGACGDFFAESHWASWGDSTAVADARDRQSYSRGSESCASAYDRAHVFRVTVRLSGRQSCGSRSMYTRYQIVKGYGRTARPTTFESC